MQESLSQQGQRKKKERKERKWRREVSVGWPFHLGIDVQDHGLDS